MYGEGTDPLPFVVAAYLIGALLLGGYGYWLYRQRLQVNAYLEALRASRSNTGEQP